MKKIIAFAMALAVGVAFTFAAKKAPELKPVNENCPFSGKAVNGSEFVDVGVCCGNCAKKAAGDIKGTLAKAKGNFAKCPFSGKPGKKKVRVAFCCGNCKKKASS